MKKFAALTALLITLAACGGTKTVYVVDTLPPEMTTTSPKTATTKPRPTTTVARYIPPTNYYSYDEQAYIDGVASLYSSYIFISDDELLDTGYAMCNTLDSGISLSTLLVILASELPPTADMAEFSSAIIASAIYNLCPEHTWQLATL